MNIETSRLILKPLTQKYVFDIFNNFTNEVTSYMFPCPAKNISETENIVNYYGREAIGGLIEYIKVLL